MIKSEVRSLLILNLVITPSLISERPLTIVSFEAHFSNISAGRIKLIVTEKGAGVNTADEGNIITDLCEGSV
jgi:hypothetical protein